MAPLRRLLSCLFLFLMLVPGVGAQGGELVGFSDVPMTHPNYPAITQLKAQGIISGYEDGTFRPEQTVTRAELLKIVLLALNVEPTILTQNQFNDIDPGSWYEPYVATAHNLGFVGGYGDGSFQPDRIVTRAEGLKILLNAKGVALTPPRTQLFTDVPVSEWYAPYVQYVADYKLLDIPGRAFGKDEGLRRKDIAQIIYRMEEAERAAALPTVPLGVGMLIAALWIATGLWSAWYLQQVSSIRSQRALAYGILGGPVILAFLMLRSLKRLPHRVSTSSGGEDLLTEGASAAVRFVRRRYTYFRRRRKLVSEILRWIDLNRVPFFGLIVAGSVIYFVYILGMTSISTVRYRASFEPRVTTEITSSTEL